MLAKILFGVVGFIALLLVIALFVKKDYNVEREITIAKPRKEVFDYLKHLKNQDYYNKWVMMDPKMKKEYRGTDGTTGFVYSWDSEEAGKGEQEIKSISEGERLDLEIRFKEPYESIAKVPFVVEEVSADQTKVKWGMQGTSPYPMNLMNLFIDNLLGKDLETSLATLKSNLEK